MRPRTTDRAKFEQRILLLLPDAQEAREARATLTSAGLETSIVDDIGTLIESLKAGAGAAIVSADELTSDDGGRLVAWLTDQPGWSDFPLLVVAADTEHDTGAWQRLNELETVGWAALLERPLRLRALVTTVRWALRARARQYELRAFLSERAAREDTLKASLAREHALIEALPHIVWTASADGTVDYVSARLTDYTGLDPDDVTGSRWDTNIHPADVEDSGRAFDNALRTGQPFEASQRLRLADGSYRWFLTRAIPLHDKIGRIERWFGTATDIDEQKSLQEERNRLLRRERQARGDAERASRMKDEFLATISHELRTPLTAILGWAQMLRRGKLSDEDRAEAIETIERSARAQRALINDLLDMSRIVAGRLRLDVKPVNLQAVIEDALGAVRPAADAKRIALEADLPAAPLIVQADANRLQQVAWNLLSNAVKFTPAGGRVDVALRLEDDAAEFEVSDTGRGIDADLLPHVFDRFRQQDSSATRAHGGLGLGLAIVKQFVEMHGGQIHVSSGGPDQGATFIVALPAVHRLAESEEPLSVRRRPHDDDEIELDPDALAGLRVVVVDDEPDSRALLSRILSDRRAEVETAVSAAEGLRVLESFRPHVLVCDLAMPEEDGLSLIRRVRALPETEGGAIPALAVTAFARPSDRAAALGAGFQRFLTKPVEPDELVLEVAGLAQQ